MSEKAIPNELDPRIDPFGTSLDLVKGSDPFYPAIILAVTDTLQAIEQIGDT